MCTTDVEDRIDLIASLGRTMKDPAAELATLWPKHSPETGDEVAAFVGAHRRVSMMLAHAAGATTAALELGAMLATFDPRTT